MTSLDTMNDALLSVVRCPTCGGELEPAVPPESHRGANGSGDSGSLDRLHVALLKCACGAAYPIIDGVPRLLEAERGAARKVADRQEATVRPSARQRNVSQDSPSRHRENDYANIRKSFSQEWGIFDYAQDKTWCWTLEERKKIFLSDVALTEDQIRGKLLLDAGCGNGTLTSCLTAFGAEVVGIDLSDRLGAANRHKARFAGERSENVHFVQGNLFNAPLKHGSFDLIYCSGVLHHTPNTKESFKRLVPLLKTGGRLYVWVYGNRSIPVRVFLGTGRVITRFLSLESLSIACRVFAPFYKVGTEFLDALGIAEFRKGTARDLALELFDAFSPRYNHHHTEEEVQGWFREKGFRNIAVSGRQKHGFGVYGDKI